MAVPAPNTRTISVPYFGEIKKGLLAVVKYKKGAFEAYGSFLYYDTNHEPSRTSYGLYMGELGINSVSYSNGSFSISIDISSEVRTDGSFSVAFLQLNLD